MPKVVSKRPSSSKKHSKSPSSSSDSTEKLPKPELPLRIPAFLTKLHAMISDSSTNSIISWTVTGLEFTLKDPQKLAAQILPQYFKHNNITSFIRQLNMYGFHKIIPVTATGVDTFAADGFHKADTNQEVKELLAALTLKRKDEVKREDPKEEVDLKVLQEIGQIKYQQSQINHDIQELQNNNVGMWQQSMELAKSYNQQKDTIEKIVGFLASVFSKKKGESGSIDPENIGSSLKLITGLPNTGPTLETLTLDQDFVQTQISNLLIPSSSNPAPFSQNSFHQDPFAQQNQQPTQTLNQSLFNPSLLAQQIQQPTQILDQSLFNPLLLAQQPVQTLDQSLFNPSLLAQQSQQPTQTLDQSLFNPLLLAQQNQQPVQSMGQSSSQNHSSFDPSSISQQQSHPFDQAAQSNFDPLAFSQFPPQPSDIFGHPSFAETLPFTQPASSASTFLPSSFAPPNGTGLFSSSSPSTYPQSNPQQNSKLEDLKHTADSLSQDIEILQDRLHDISDTIGINKPSDIVSWNPFSDSTLDEYNWLDPGGVSGSVLPDGDDSVKMDFDEFFQTP